MRTALTEDRLVPVGASMLALAAALAVVRSPAPTISLVIGCAAVAIFIYAPPHVTLAAVVAALGTFQLSYDHPLRVGGIQVYTTDLLMFVLALRAARSLRRYPRDGFMPLTRIIFGCFFGFMAIAVVHGFLRGTPLQSLVRIGVPVIYLPIFYWSLSRLLSEDAFDWGRAFRASGLVVASLVAWMFAMRAAGHPFETGVNHLGRVELAGGVTVRRDYGFSSAYIMYPALAIVAFALALTRGRRRVPIALGVLGVIGTAATLIRGETYGLFVGLCLLFILAGRRAARGGRVRVLAMASGAAVLVFAIVAAVSPTLLAGITERSVPGIGRQSSYAQQTAAYRVQAFSAAVRFARARPLGVGMVQDSALQERGVDPGYVAHSAYAWLLVYAGWGGLVLGGCAAAAAMAESWRHRDELLWRHPAYVSLLLMLLVYSGSAVGVLGQAWIVVLLALVLAARFAGQAQVAAREVEA